MSDTAYVSVLPDCDIHKHSLNQVNVPAAYDARVRIGGRPVWAYVCESCFSQHGDTFGQLGTGKGQRLVVGEKPYDGPRDLSGNERPDLPDLRKRDAIRKAIRTGNFDEAEELIGDGDLMEWL